MNRAAALAYGVICYLLFLAVFLYAIGSVGNLEVPRSIDSGTGADTGWALLTDLVLLGLFAVPHSVMARPWFKERWTQIIPPVAEHSTYVLVSSLLLALLFWLWLPLAGVVWDCGGPIGRTVLHGLFWIGWGIALVSTFLTDHFDLFGLRQVWLYACGRPYLAVGFRAPLFYRYVRHPLMLGFLIAYWATPTMTIGHLLFAAATTAYIFVAIQLEERDLLRTHGQVYEEYQRRVSMLVPRPWESRFRATHDQEEKSREPSGVDTGDGRRAS